MNEDIQKIFSESYQYFLKNSVNPQFYSQLAIIFVSAILAYSLAKYLEKSKVFQKTKGSSSLFFKDYLLQFKELLVPLVLVLSLSIAIDICDHLLNSSAITKFFLSLSVVFLIYSFINRFVQKKFIRKIIVTIIIPIALLRVFGFLDEVVTYLDNRSLELGTIKISLYGLVRAVLFGSILFWLGRTSNKIGQDVIRRQEELDLGTKELAAKLFQVVLTAAIFVVLLQIMGINLTTLAVFSGALGVGLGFGLQSIASNFISGIILLLEKTLSIGDYVDMGGGKSGIVRELNMRSTILESYDGKDLMIPNEKFITQDFTNWTRKNKKQRYEIKFQVSYETDLEKMIELVKAAVREHPQVLNSDSISKEEKADVEIASFGDSGVNILIEFWMEGIDDGVNRVKADLFMIIWKVLKENNIEIPFPHRVIQMQK